MALSPVTATETRSKTEYAEELSMVFRQNPGLLVSQKDHSKWLVVRRLEALVLDKVLLYRLFKQQSATVRNLSSAILHKIGQVSAFMKHSFCTSLRISFTN